MFNCYDLCVVGAQQQACCLTHADMPAGRAVVLRGEGGVYVKTQTCSSACSIMQAAAWQQSISIPLAQTHKAEWLMVLRPTYLHRHCD